MNTYVLLMMGGIGSRFGAEIPKQFTMVNERPLFTYIAKKLSEQDCITGIIIVVTESWLNYTKEWIDKLNIKNIIAVVKGGDTRSESVRNGLRALVGIAGDNDPVLMHDATHPYVDEEGTRKVSEMVREL